MRFQSPSLLRLQHLLLHRLNDVTIHLPEELHNRNGFIQVEYDGKIIHQTLFSQSLDIVIYEQTGRLFVRSRTTHLPLPGVYVKVFGRTSSFDSKGKFVKDGFTDLRGCFDYASLSKESSAPQYRTYSILILSETLGSDVKEVSAPSEF